MFGQPGQQEAASPEMDALMGARGSAMPQPGMDKMNPASQNEEGSELFLDRKLFMGGKPKEGQPITVSGTITSVGDKIGFAPMACSPGGEKEPSAEGESDSSEYDEDLNDSVD